MQAEMRVNGFSGTILLARKGAPIVARGYGPANAEWSIPNTPRTKFRLGSITKQFTSMAVMQLQQQGKLKVQDPICQYLTPCPDAWKPITIHHLLTHTSGIPSYTNSPSYMTTMMVPKTVDQMVAGFRDLPLEFEPGAQFKYNNSGYFLLGVLLEKVTGQPYERVLGDQIFTPLGMQDSGYDSPTRILPLRASGYSRQGSESTNAPYLDMVQPFAAGALYSTVEDLLKWDQALYTDKLLPSAARTEMFTPFKGNYAYGWQVPTPSPQTFGTPAGRPRRRHQRFLDDDHPAAGGEHHSIVLSNVQQAPDRAASRAICWPSCSVSPTRSPSRARSRTSTRRCTTIRRAVSAHADVHPDRHAGRRPPDDAGDGSAEARGLSGVGNEVLSEGRRRAAHVRQG